MCFSRNRTIRMSDSDLFSMASSRNKFNKLIFKKKCSILAFLSKNVGPGKVVRNLSGSLYSIPMLRRPSVVVVRRRPFTISDIFSSETAWLNKAKFYVEPPWEGGKKIYINCPGHMTKMAAMPIYGNNIIKSSSPEPEV